MRLSSCNCAHDPPCHMISNSAEIASAIATSKGSSCRRTRLFNKKTTVTLYWGSEESGLGTTVTTKSEEHGTIHTFFWLSQSDETIMACECIKYILAGNWDLHQWHASESMELITFIFDTVVGHHWLQASDCAMMGHLLLDLSTYAYELGPAIHSWAHSIGEERLDIGQAMTESPTSTLHQSNICHFTRREYKLNANGTSFSWEYDPQESALELCREYEHLLLHYCCELKSPTLKCRQTWPYSDNDSRSTRLPRKVKRARKRGQAKTRRKAARAPHIPGSFPVPEGEDYSQCPYCGKH